MPSRCILILLDGLADHSHPELGGLTPLAAAHTPVMDYLVSQGAAGHYCPGPMGVANPSEEAHFALFGYEDRHFPGRGVLEALGAGLKVNPAEVYVLARLSCLEDRAGELWVRQYKPTGDAALAAELMAEVTPFSHQGLEITWQGVKGLSGLLRITGPASRLVSDTSPLGQGRLVQKAMPLDEAQGDRARLERARNTAEAVNRLIVRAYETWPGPINGILTQRPGRLLSAPRFAERWGLRAATISAGVLYQGIGRYLGMAAMADPDTGEPGLDLARRLQKARELLADHQFVHVHSKAPDQAGHAKDPGGKKRVIEELDQALGSGLGPLLDDPETLVVVTADHATPSSGPLVHSGEPVPLLAKGLGVWQDQVKHFDEVSCAGGCLGRLQGVDFMRLVLNWLGMARLQGTRDGAADCPYWPGPVQPLEIKGD